MDVPIFQISIAEGSRPGAHVAFPYDRDLVRRFREVFPRARWRSAEERWFVPGSTAMRRLEVWAGQELETLDRHADAKGRDAFAFDPLESPYLEVGEDLAVRTPYSSSIVEAMRAIPWAGFDRRARAWRVPFRSYEALRARWPEIEEEARRNEPEARRLRRHADSGGEADKVQAERRRRRFPVPGDDLPPLDSPVATGRWGVVVFEDIDPRPVQDPGLRAIYPHLPEAPGGYVFGRWRMPELWEIHRAKPDREETPEALRATRGWWWPSRDELKERARRLRQIERAQRTRGQGKAQAEA